MPGLAVADERYFCHQMVDSSLDEKLLSGCQAGDIVVMQISSTVAPIPLVARFCDFSHSIVTENRTGQFTVTCVLVHERERRRISD